MLMFLIISFRKSFKNIMLVLFFELFGQDHKFETRFEIFFEIFFSNVNVKSFKKNKSINKFIE